MAKQLFTAIIFFPEHTAKMPAKYRNISNPISFAKFALKQGGWYINWYFKESRLFSHREKLI